MQMVATLIAPGAHAPLTPALIEELRTRLPSPSGLETLAPGFAVDITFEAPVDALATIRREAATWLGDRPVDMVVQPAGDRRKAVLIADMDSTMIGQECIDELAAEAGLKSAVAAITERAMRGEIAFEPALRERVALLAGLPRAVIGQVIRDRITVTPGAAVLVRTMAAHGAYCSLVSGGFTAFTAVIADFIGFHENRANVLEIHDEKLTGSVAEPILGKNAKRERLEQLCRCRGLPASAVLAVGDGANDIAMIEAAGLGVAYHAKPALAAVADASIIHADLSALLFVQGYRRGEWVDV